MTFVDPSIRALIESSGLEPWRVDEVITRALEEDLGAEGDVTTIATVTAGQSASAALVPRAAGVVAGLPVAAWAFHVVGEGDVRVEFHTIDGAEVVPGERLATVTGPVSAILTAERTSLNLLCHLSGVASLTRQWVDAVEGTGAQIRDTRKTMPGLRALEKYAVRCGGGVNHRMSLSDAALVKDNHVAAAGSVARAFELVRERWPELAVEVEVDTADQAREALQAGADLILLDNMGLAQLRSVVQMAAEFPGVRLEASGGLTLQNAREVALTGVDFLAVGALTHSAPVLDIGLDLL